MIMLRSAFSGKTLGSSTRVSNGFHLPKGTYRMTLVICAQPGRTGVLFDDTEAGMPQRFMWFPAKDSRVPEERTPWPGELSLANAATSDVLKYGATLNVPAAAERAIRAARVRDQRGEGNPLDSHRLYVREKFAYALTILDGRDRMTEEDWELSGVAMEVSDHTREWITARRLAADNEEAQRQGRVSGTKRAAADEEHRYQITQRQAHIGRRVLEKLGDAGDEGLTKREVDQLFKGRDRYLMTTVVLPNLIAAKEVKECVRKGDRRDTKRYRIPLEGDYDDDEKF